MTDWAKTIDTLSGHVRRLRMTAQGMIARGVVELVNDSLKTQRLQITVLGDDPLDEVEHLQPYGLSFVPPAGAEALALSVGGSSAHTVALCVQHPGERPKGAHPREGGLYNKGEWRVFVDADGVVCVGSKTSAEHIPLGDMLAQLLAAHTHPTAMGPSGPPVNASSYAQALSKHKVAP